MKHRMLLLTGYTNNISIIEELGKEIPTFQIRFYETAEINVINL